MNQIESLMNKEILKNIQKNILKNIESASEKAFYYIPFAIKILFQYGEISEKEKKEIIEFYYVF